MSLCSNSGLDIRLDYSDKESIIPKLFSEEVGYVIEIDNEKLTEVKEDLTKRGLFFDEVGRKNIWDKGFDKLPKEIKDYISFIEKRIECRVTILSVGPQRHETIIR